MMAESKYGIPKFNGKGYRNWRTQALNGFRAENLELALNEANVAKRAFAGKNNRCLQLITQSLGDSHLTYVRNAAYAYDVLQNLDAIYGVTNQETIQYLRQKWQALRLKSNGDIFQHLNEFDTIVDNLNDAGCELTDNEIITQLLISMPNEYKITVKLLQNNPNLTLPTAKRLLINEYHALTRENEDIQRQESKAAMSTERSNSSRNDQSKSGDNNNSNPNPNRNSTSSRCFNCNLPNHYQKDCRKPKNLNKSIVCERCESIWPQ